MTSTVLPPATASVPMVRAMFPVPMMLMLLMMCPVLTDDRRVGCSRLSGVGDRWAAWGSGYRWTSLAGIPAAAGVSRSDRRGAAVGNQFHSIHVARVVRGEEQRDRRDLLGAAHLSPRDQGLELPLRLLVEQFLLLRRGDLAGGQHVHPDPPVLQLGQPHAGVGLLDGLARRVHAPPGVAPLR